VYFLAFVVSLSVPVQLIVCKDSSLGSEMTCYVLGGTTSAHSSAKSKFLEIIVA